MKTAKTAKTAKKVIRTLLVPAIAASGLLAGTLSSTAASAGDSYGYVGYNGGYGGHGGYSAGYGHRWGGGHNRYRGGHRRGHHGGHGVGNALLGAALGVTLFSVIQSSNRSRSYDRYQSDRYYDRDRRDYRGYDDGYYSERTYVRPPADLYRYEAAPQRSNVVNPLQARQSDMFANCLQTREYQTTVTIGGEERDAYGTACLQADGSWLQGAPKIVPIFD